MITKKPKISKGILELFSHVNLVTMAQLNKIRVYGSKPKMIEELLKHPDIFIHIDIFIEVDGINKQQSENQVFSGMGVKYGV